jgi:uncharacterized protein YcfJ
MAIDWSRYAEGPATSAAEEPGSAGGAGLEGRIDWGQYASVEFATPVTPEPEEPLDDLTWEDYGRGIAGATAEMVAGASWLSEQLAEFTNLEGPRPSAPLRGARPADEPSAIGQASTAVKELAGNAAQAWVTENMPFLGQEGLSGVARRAQATGYLDPDADLYTKWQKTKLLLVASLPATAAGMGVGAGLTRGLAAAGAGRTTAATVGYATGEAAVAAPLSAATVEETVLEIPVERLMKESPRFTEIYASLPEDMPAAERGERARETLASMAAWTAFGGTAVTTGIASAPFGKLMDDVITGAVGAAAGRVRAAGQGAATEAVQETVQSAAEQVSQNVGVQMADPSRGTFEGAAEAAVGGFAAGTAMGGAVGAAVGPGTDADLDADLEGGRLLEEARRRAETIAREGGGDALDAALAGETAAAATAEAMADSLDQQLQAARAEQGQAARALQGVGEPQAGEQLTGEQLVAEAVARQRRRFEEAAARAQREMDAGGPEARQAEEQEAVRAARAQTAREQDPDFEAAQAQRRQAEEDAAYRQRAEQAAADELASAEAQAPAPAPPAAPTLGDVAPALAVARERLRAAREAAETPAAPTAAQTPAPAPEPQPLLLEDQRPELAVTPSGETVPRETQGARAPVVTAPRPPDLGVAASSRAQQPRAAQPAAEPEPPRLTKSGAPFKTPASARRAAATQKELEGYEPVQVPGGWGLQRPMSVGERAQQVARNLTERRAQAAAAAATSGAEAPTARATPEDPERPFRPTPEEDISAELPALRGQAFVSSTGEALRGVGGETIKNEELFEADWDLAFQTEALVELRADDGALEVIVGGFGMADQRLTPAQYRAVRDWAEANPGAEIRLRERSLTDDLNEAMLGPADVFELSELPVSPSPELQAEIDAERRRRLARAVKPFNAEEKRLTREWREGGQQGPKPTPAREFEPVLEDVNLSPDQILEAEARVEAGESLRKVVQSLPWEAQDVGPGGTRVVEQNKIQPAWAAPEEPNNLAADLADGPFVSEAEAEQRLASWKSLAERLRGGRQLDNVAVISLFDTTGVISAPWRAAGARVFQYDLNLGNDLLANPPLEDFNFIFETASEIVVLAQPPCTTMTGSGRQHWYTRHNSMNPAWVERTFGSNARAETFFGQFESATEYNQALIAFTNDVIARLGPRVSVIENPGAPTGGGRSRIDDMTGIGEPTAVVQPHNFGDPYTKQTWLWGQFNPDLPTANVEPTQGSKMHALGSSAEKDRGERSATPEGLAWSLFAANAELVAQEPVRTLNDRRARDAVAAPLEERAEVTRNTPEEVAARRARNEAAGRVERPYRVETAADVDAAAQEAATAPAAVVAGRLDTSQGPPTQAQIEAGNYRKGRLNLQGLDISIESPKGSTRSGRDEMGREWSREMKDHYGYIRRTEGADGEQMDVFVGPDPQSDRVFIIDQLRQDTGGFDEHKAFVGYPNQLSAMRAYRRNYDADWRMGPVTEMSMAEFKAWLRDGDTTAPVQGQPQMVTQEDLGALEARARRGGRRGRRGNVAFREGDGADGIPAEDTRAAATAATSSVEGANVQIVDQIGELPVRLYALLSESGNLGARGLYDRETNTSYVILENHRTAKDAARTVLHEALGHNGLAALLGNSRPAILEDIYDNASEGLMAGIEGAAARYGLDLNVRTERLTAVEEFVAEQAETYGPRPFMRRVIDAVRSFLRGLGLVQQWTDGDIIDLLARGQQALRNQPTAEPVNALPSEVAPEQNIALRIEDEAQERINRDPTSPLSRLHKLGATVEDQANYNPGLGDKLLDWAKDNYNSNGVSSLLALLPRRYLSDFISQEDAPAVQGYIDTANRMAGYRNELLVQHEELLGTWESLIRKKPRAAAQLGDLMHTTTLAGVDPSKPFQPLKARKNMTDADKAVDTLRRQQHVLLKDYYEQLPAEAQKLYRDVRDAYSGQRQETMDALTRRIERSEADGRSKSQLVDELRKKFEAGRVQGPYFPLARYGDLWAVAKDENGEVLSYARFENRSEQQAWIKEWTAAGAEVTPGKKMDTMSEAKKIDPAFVAKVQELVDDPTIADDIWQLYLQALPELSMRKQFIHRKGRLGFTVDAVRAFGTTMFHSSHQLAKVEFGDQLEQQLIDLRDQVIAIQSANDDRLELSAALYDEMVKRHNASMVPNASSWSVKTTALGFAWYLGVTPAAAVVNLTQTPLVAFPLLAARFNSIGATKELLGAAKLYASTLGALENKLRGDEQKAVAEARRIGLFDKTQSHDLAGLSQQGGIAFGSNTERMMKIASWTFHKAEQFNREVTFLAAYRLARANGRSHEDAILESEKLTWDAHFDYNNDNRPVFMQQDLWRVITLFKQYSINMTYRMTRDFNDSIRAEDPEVKTEARWRFAGMMGMTALMAGFSGLPIVTNEAVKWITNALFSDPEDEDYFDYEVAMRAYLAESLGVTAADAIMKGPVDALTGLTLSERVSLANLWFREPGPNDKGDDLFMHYFMDLAGPIPSIVKDVAFSAPALLDEGHTYRGIEKLMPKFVRDGMRAYRYATEGALTLHSPPDTLVRREDFTELELFYQTMGFVPAQLTRQYEQNRALRAAEGEILARRDRVTDRYHTAVLNGDKAGAQEALRQITAFNLVHPQIAITGDTLRIGAQNRLRRSAESRGGAALNRRLWFLYDELSFTPKRDTENAEPDTRP